MRTTRLIITLLLNIATVSLFAQAGAGMKYGNNRKAYTDSIKNSNYKWIFPAWGKKLTKKGFDVPYPIGIMINPFIASQKVNISDLQVGFNGNEPVALDFIKFSEVKANLQSVTVRPDLWVLPFLDVYGIAGASYAQTNVSISDPVAFSTKANFHGSTFGIGTTLAGGYHGIITIIDINHTWSFMNNIDGSAQATMFTPRIGYNFLFKQKPYRNVAVWAGVPGFFINTTTQGTFSLSGKININKDALEEIVQETAAWYQDLKPAQQKVVKEIAQKLLDKISGIDIKDAYVNYSLKKRPASNWSMCVGAQYQFNHSWQVRTEIGFLGGRKSLLLSANYRFRR
ncbi:hypothetical protein [Deminuibacter soli]|uniref:Uncharacterized protein n=1 Tax=Deminuibacter soli TaxID=2291815 RepID=A0A3E1NHP6_9BACT|nr:hypothetical protein [Deminuibacter soli]RFM27308.1 hypothetical protein DXN05_14870 [Deminuibacter soli]